MQDVPHTGCKTTADEDELKAPIEINRHITTRETAKNLEVSYSTVRPMLYFGDTVVGEV